MNKILKNIKYGKNHIEFILKAGEEYSPQYLFEELGASNYNWFVKNQYISTLGDSAGNTDKTQEALDDAPQEPIADNEVTNNEIMYKTQEALECADGKIRKNTKLTAAELASKGFDKEALLTEGKIIEIKVTEK